METVNLFFEKLNNKLGKDGKTAFLSAFIIGILTHMTALTLDAPNHDGLASMYFDQNMITSGRWFLSTACGISSYYSIPWLIGVLSLIYLGISSIILNKLLKVENGILICLISGMLVAFPSIASDFAYVFTMDGYMLGVLFAILSVYFAGFGKYGFLLGALFLALSMGIYQAYLPIAMLLCLYKVVEGFFYEGNSKIRQALRYLCMGAIGVTLYYAILRLLLLIQGKTLDSYQGIDSLSSAGSLNLPATIKAMYTDFVTFILKGKILASNVFSAVAFVLLILCALIALLILAKENGLLKKPLFYIGTIIVIIITPVISNIILLISKDVTYHLLMRYQYAFFGIIFISIIDKALKLDLKLTALAWTMVIAGLVIVFSFAVTDNIAYSNLEKKYEKTYAYCLRLADRIEQTQGYYQGIPIYMIGVVGDTNFPKTDITGEVTDHMVGLYGDWLLYTPENYEYFYKYYMGITFNFLRPTEANFYDSAEYVNMPSFPETGSTKVVDGILYVKTENMH